MGRRVTNRHRPDRRLIINTPRRWRATARRRAIKSGTINRLCPFAVPRRWTGNISSGDRLRSLALPTAGFSDLPNWPGNSGSPRHRRERSRSGRSRRTGLPKESCPIPAAWETNRCRRQTSPRELTPASRLAITSANGPGSTGSARRACSMRAISSTGRASSR